MDKIKNIIDQVEKDLKNNDTTSFELITGEALYYVLEKATKDIFTKQFWTNQKQGKKNVISIPIKEHIKNNIAAGLKLLSSPRFIQTDLQKKIPIEYKEKAKDKKGKLIFTSLGESVKNNTAYYNFIIEIKSISGSIDTWSKLERMKLVENVLTQIDAGKNRFQDNKFYMAGDHLVNQLYDKTPEQQTQLALFGANKGFIDHEKKEAYMIKGFDVKNVEQVKAINCLIKLVSDAIMEYEKQDDIPRALTLKCTPSKLAEYYHGINREDYKNNHIPTEHRMKAYSSLYNLSIHKFSSIYKKRDGYDSKGNPKWEVEHDPNLLLLKLISVYKDVNNKEIEVVATSNNLDQIKGKLVYHKIILDPIMTDQIKHNFIAFREKYLGKITGKGKRDSKYLHKFNYWFHRTKRLSIKNRNNPNQELKCTISLLNLAYHIGLDNQIKNYKWGYIEKVVNDCITHYFRDGNIKSYTCNLHNSTKPKDAIVEIVFEQVENNDQAN